MIIEDFVKELSTEFLERSVKVIVVERNLCRMILPHYSSDDPVLSELSQRIQDAGFKCRIWLPDTVGTMDFNTNRINVFISKVGSDFKISEFKVG